MKLKNKDFKEAQREVDKIFSKYSKLIVEELSNEIPKGSTLTSVNGMCWLKDSNGKIIGYGNSHGHSLLILQEKWTKYQNYNTKLILKVALTPIL